MGYPHENFLLLPFVIMIISFSLLTPITSGDEFIDNDRLVTVRCQKNNSNVSKNYIRNLDYVIAHINNTNPSKEDRGFINATYSSNGIINSDTVYSLVQCRGDVTDTNCSTCLSDIAALKLSSICPDGNTRGAVVTREKCFLKCSDQDFFGKLDKSLDTEYYPFCSFDNNIAAGGSKAMVKSLLDSLVTYSINATKIMFAKGLNKTSDGSAVVEAMAECRGDLALPDCTNCLTNAKTNLLGNCSEKPAGKYFLASCNIGFAWNGSNIY